MRDAQRLEQPPQEQRGEDDGGAALAEPAGGLGADSEG
jgi:hypothetical protein